MIKYYVFDYLYIDYILSNNHYLIIYIDYLLIIYNNPQSI